MAKTIVAPVTREGLQGLDERLDRTLALMNRWGYVPHLQTLADQLLGGSVDASELEMYVRSRSDLLVNRGFVGLPGSEDLIPQSQMRVESNRSFAKEAQSIANDFANDLARACPMVESIALSGSLASGGFEPHDDIDFDLIVRPGTKYTSYLVATLVGLRYSLRFRKTNLADVHRTPLFPKITCINVVWPTDQATPFVRQDENMAFELLQCIPLVGVRSFHSVLMRNVWIRAYFPQVYDKARPDEPRGTPNFLGRVLNALSKDAGLLRVVESASRRISWFLYRSVQNARRGNTKSVERMEFLRRVKFPYEAFQD